MAGPRCARARLVCSGSYYRRKNNKAGDFIVSKFEDIIKKIIPFFIKYPLIEAKSLDFVDFCKIATLMESKKHLTLVGFEENLKVKSGMNDSRIG